MDCFYLAKSTDIAYITLLYLTSAYFCAYNLDKIFSNIYDKKFSSNKSANNLFVEISVQIMITSIVSYAVRNLIMMIPSPLHGVCAFDHYKVKELNSGPILLMFLIIFQKNLQKKIALLREMM